MGEKLAGMLGSKSDGYLFMFCLEVSYAWSSSVTILWTVVFNTFISDSKKKSEITHIKTANDTKPGGCSQCSHSKGATQGHLDKLEERTKQSPVPGKD